MAVLLYSSNKSNLEVCCSIELNSSNTQVLFFLSLNRRIDRVRVRGVFTTRVQVIQLCFISYLNYLDSYSAHTQRVISFLQRLRSCRKSHPGVKNNFCKFQSKLRGQTSDRAWLGSGGNVQSFDSLIHSRFLVFFANSFEIKYFGTGRLKRTHPISHCGSRFKMDIEPIWL